MSALIAVVIAGCSNGETLNPIQQQPNATLQVGQLIGGGTKQITVDSLQVGKFLPQPELLTPGGRGKAGLVYLDPSVDFFSYHKVLLDPVAIWAGPNSELNSVPADQQRAPEGRTQHDSSALCAGRHKGTERNDQHGGDLRTLRKLSLQRGFLSL